MHTLRVKEKYYNLLKDKKKTIELRLYDEKRQAIKIGDTIEFSDYSKPNDKFLAKVINLHRADNFAALCQKIDCSAAGFAANDELLEVLEEFYSSKQQQEYGVVGIEIKIEN